MTTAPPPPRHQREPLTVDLGGQTALVTGASRGIGARIAIVLARAGARLAIHYARSKDAAQFVAKEVERVSGYRPHLAVANLSDPNARRRLYEETVQGVGAPLILVHNAGIFVRNPMYGDDVSFLDRWRHTMSVNLESAAHLTFLALPAMRRARQGRIVLVSSRAAFRGETDCPDYAVSKAGMVNLARTLARAEGGNGITANAVCPGWVNTEMAAKDLVERGEEIRAEIPLGRVATPEDVANAVLFFVSPLGSYANGTALGLNGGSFLH